MARWAERDPRVTEVWGRLRYQGCALRWANPWAFGPTSTGVSGGTTTALRTESHLLRYLASFAQLPSARGKAREKWFVARMVARMRRAKAG